MHGHAHHNHERKMEEIEPRGDLEERGDVVIVYKTVEPDFIGEVGGYLTGNDDTTEANTATKANVGVGAAVGVHATTTKEQTTEARETDEPTTTKPKEQATTTQQTEAKTTQETKADTTQTTKAETTEQTEKSDSETSTSTSQDSQASVTATSFVTSASQTSDPSPSVDNILAATSSGSATDSAASSSSTAIGSTTSEGMTGGAKAGVAIGVIFGVGVIAALIFFLIRKKKNKAQDGYQQENEKAFGGEGLPEGYANSLPPPLPAKPGTPSTPPVLNVRPVTQFAPDLSGNGGFNPAAAGAVGAAGVAAGSAAVASRNLTRDTPPATSPKPAVDSPNPFSDPVNPFGSALTPVTEHAPSIAESSTGPSGTTVAAAAVGTAAGGAAVAAAASSRKSTDSDSYQSAHSRGHSPTESNQSSTMRAPYAEGMAAGAGAAPGPIITGAGGPPPPNNVHRVQLDFNPSMEDELGLRSGSLVRLIHEYDDGWVSWGCIIPKNKNNANTLYRRCASASMAPNKVLLPDLACQHAP
jgi:hypothetical protein